MNIYVRFWLFCLFAATVAGAPTIDSQTRGRLVVEAGQTTMLSVVARGAGDLVYSWRRNGLIVPGATGATFAVTGNPQERAWYQPVVRDGAGETAGAAVFVVVKGETQVVASLGLEPAALAGLETLRDVVQWNGWSPVAFVRKDGRVVYWNTSTGVLTHVAPALSDVVAAQRGYGFDVFLLGDGTVVKTNPPNGTTFTPILDNVVSVATMSRLVCGVKIDGTVVKWNSESPGVVSVVEGIDDAVQVAGNRLGGLILRRSGAVVALRPYGGADLSQPAGSTATEVALDFYGVARRSDGTVAVWGDSGQLTPPTGLTGVAGVAASFEHVLAFREDGTVVTWTRAFANPVRFPGTLDAVFAVSASTELDLVLRDMSADVAPTVIQQPANVSAYETRTAIFSAGLSGHPAPAVRWQRRSSASSAWRELADGEAYKGTQTTTLTVSSLDRTMTGDRFRSVGVNSRGEVVSEPATLSVTPAAEILAQSPRREVVNAGDPLRLYVESRGVGALSYQWTRDGRAIPGATGPTYEVASAAGAHAGVYRVTVSDSVAQRKSAPIFVGVVQPNRISAWGSGAQAAGPAGLEDVIQLSGHGFGSFALRHDGSVAGWTGVGRLSVLQGINDVVQIDASLEAIYALRANGRVAEWAETGVFTSGLAGITDAIAIAAGRQFIAVLRENGHVMVSGSASGMTARDTVGDVVAITASDYAVLGMRADGTVVAWGGEVHNLSPVPAGATGPTMVDAGSFHALALKPDGTVMAWGLNHLGQLPIPAGLAGIVEVAAGESSTLARRADGSLVGWGQSGTLSSVIPGSAAPALGLASGRSLLMAISQRTVAGTAPVVVSSPAATLTVREDADLALAVVVNASPAPRLQWQRRRAGGAQWETITDNEYFKGAATTTLAIRRTTAGLDGSEFRCVVNNGVGPSVFSEPTRLTVEPLPEIALLSPARVVVTSGESTELRVEATGTGNLSYVWYRDGRIVEGATGPTLRLNSFTVADSGTYQVRVTDVNGSRFGPPSFVIGHFTSELTKWAAYSGVLAPLPTGLDDVVSIGSTQGYDLALRRDGTVKTWGSFAADAVGLTNAESGVSIASARFSSALLKADGSVVIGSGEAPPVEVREVVQISLGLLFYAALRQDGTVITWGNPLRNAPAEPIRDGLQISAGTDHLLVLRRDHTVVAWGENQDGQCTVPAGLNDVASVFAGNKVSIAVKRDGSVGTWGATGTGRTLAPVVMNDPVTVIADWVEGLWLGRDTTVTRWGRPDAAAIPSRVVGTLSLVLQGYDLLALGDRGRVSRPVVTQASQNATVVELLSTEFSVVATGTPPVEKYQWQWRVAGGEWADATDGRLFAGAKTATLRLSKVPLSVDGAEFRCAVSSIDTTVSPTATLSVRAVAHITAHSALRQMVTPGMPLMLSVAASSSSAMTYQWERNGVPIPGATGAGFFKADATADDSGWYRVLITDSVGVRPGPAMFVRVAGHDLKVVAWGRDVEGQTTVPADVGDVVDLAAGANNSASVRRDGSLVVWGSSANGITTVPAGLADVVQVSIGYTHILALKSDGTVVAWGSNGWRESTVPAGLTDVVAVAAGGDRSFALKSDGTVEMWGQQAGYSLASLQAFSGIVGIYSTGSGVIAWRADGSVFTWGLVGAIPPLAGGYAQIAGGSSAMIALGRSGELFTWGPNDLRYKPRDLGPLARVVAAGFVLQKDGRVRAWGLSSSGTTHVPPEAVNAVALATGFNHALALSDSTRDIGPTFLRQPASAQVNAGESAHFFVEATGTPAPRYRWQRLTPGAVNWLDLSPDQGAFGTRSDHLVLNAVTLTMSGDRFRCVVENRYGTNLSREVSLSVAAPPAVPPLPRLQVIEAGGRVTLFGPPSRDAHASYTWLRNGAPLAGQTAAALTIPGVTLADAAIYECVVADAAGMRTSGLLRVLVQTTDTRISYSGSMAVSPTRILLPGDKLRNAWALAGGGETFLAIREDHTAMGWGANHLGQAAVPAGLTQVVALATSGSHSLALRRDGTVVAWGYNASGQATVPSGLRDVVAISTGETHSVALRADGTVVCWGENTRGQAPAAVDLTGTFHVSAGGNRTIVARGEGEVSVWGSDSNGANLIAPNLAPALGVLTTGEFAAALHRDGSITDWGSSWLDRFPPPADLPGVLSLYGRNDQITAHLATEDVVSWGGGTNVSSGGLGRKVFAYAQGRRDHAYIHESIMMNNEIIGSYAYALAGETVGFEVKIESDLPVTLQWRKGSVDIAGETGPILVLKNVQVSDTGYYSVSVSNGINRIITPSIAFEVEESFENFVQHRFTAEQRTVEGISGLDSDPDFDGWRNLQEYAFGTDPNVSDGPEHVAVRVIGDTLLISFTRRDDVGDLIYTPQISLDLVTWSESAADVETITVSKIDGVREQVTARFPRPLSSVDRVFFRLSVSRPTAEPTVP